MINSIFDPEPGRYFLPSSATLARTDKWFVPELRSYIPLIFWHESFIGKDILYWADHSQSIRGSYSKIYKALKGYYSLSKTFNRTDVLIRVARGIVHDEDFKIHFMITINKEFIFNNPYERFRVYMTLEFTDPKGRFRNIYKKFKKDFLDEAVNLGVQLMIVRDIDALYQDTLISPEFESMEESIDYLNNLGSILYHQDEED